MSLRPEASFHASVAPPSKRYRQTFTPERIRRGQREASRLRSASCKEMSNKCRYRMTKASEAIWKALLQIALRFRENSST